MAANPPQGLRCEWLVEPLGVDTGKPRFSWRLESGAREEREAAWQIAVASARELIGNGIGDFWDSGLVEKPRPALVEYEGEPLASCARYFWRVRWKSSAGTLSPWSEPATFATAFLAEGEWKPRWISQRDIKEFSSRGTVLLGEASGESVQAQAVYLRREFGCREKPVLALAFFSGLGHFEFRLNGAKVGDRVLDPGWTDYKKRALYATFDITDLLQARNAAAVILGNGRHIKAYGFDPPKLAGRVEVEYESGDREIISTDESWRTSGGPLQQNGLYFGERYDARLEMPGWDLPDFDDSGWARAVTVQGPALVSQMMPPVRVAETLEPVARREASPGSWVFDFGQNFSGWVRLRVTGLAGTEIRLRHAELLHEDWTLNTGSLENAEATDVYILRGGEPETYEPRFTYHGFRFVEMTGYPGEPPAEALEGRFVHSDVRKTGSFECSDAVVNAIHRAATWGQLSNLMSIPTDCPQRDERQGWLGDAHLSAEEAVFNFDMAAFYAKFLDDIRLAMRDDGSLPDVAPPYLERLYPADPAWSSAYPTLMWLHYEHYEDGRLLARHYAPLKKYVEFLRRNASGHIVRTLGKYGDWCPPGSIVPKKTPVELTATWFYYHDVLIAARVARVLGRGDDVKAYEALAAEIRSAFNAEFLRDDQYAAVRVGPVDTYPNQTSNLLPLLLDMVPEDKKDKVLGNLIRSVVRLQDFHVDTGILGTHDLLDVLWRNGYSEAAWRVATQTSYPGWGYMIAEGATTLWERWEKLTGNGMNSQNHIMLGSVDAWFYRTLAGLNLVEPGWKRFEVRPGVVGGLTSAAAVTETVRGRVRASWTKGDASFSLEVSVPVGSEARVLVPVFWKDAPVTESGRVVHPSALDGGCAVFAVGSGDYRFEVKKETS